MPVPRLAFVHEVELQLEPGTDPAAVGAAVTTELFVAPAAEEDEVRERIEHGLREASGWVVLETRARPVSAQERPLARRLATS